MLGFTGKNKKKENEERKRQGDGGRRRGRKRRGKKREVWVEEVPRGRKGEGGKLPLLKFSKHTSHNKHVEVKGQLARIGSFLP